MLILLYPPEQIYVIYYMLYAGVCETNIFGLWKLPSALCGDTIRQMSPGDCQPRTIVKRLRSEKSSLFYRHCFNNYISLNAMAWIQLIVLMQFIVENSLDFFEDDGVGRRGVDGVLSWFDPTK